MPISTPDSVPPDTPALPAGTTAQPVPRPSRRGAWQRISHNRWALGSLIIVVIIVAAALAAPWLAPADPDVQALGDRLQGPSSNYWLGTDAFGRDILSRLLYASRISLLAALVSVSVAAAIGITAGLLAGYRGGVTDALVSVITDAFMSIPGIVLALAIIAARGSGLGNAMLAIGIILSPAIIRVVRASTFDVKGETFVLAERSIGVSSWRLLVRHIIPNISGPLLVQLSFATGIAFLAEAALSFLGVGVQAPQASWGSMMQSGYTTITQTIWPIVPPAVAMTLTIAAAFFLSDAISERDTNLGGEAR